MKSRSLLLIACIIILAACKKEPEEYRPEFIGHWWASISNDNDFATLDIGQDYYARYNICLYKTDNTYEGASCVRGDKLMIGKKDHFDIVGSPQPIDTAVNKYYILNRLTGQYELATWKMTLDGLKPGWKYADGEHTFYKTE